MARFDLRLVSPPLGRLVEALVEATAAANDGLQRRLLPFERAHWEEFVPQVRGQREGRRQWSDTHQGDTARVVITWWTDHLKRRHVRVVAGNSRDGSYRSLSSTRTDPRPPLWHVFPDRLFYRRKGQSGEWLAVCACGAAGAPEALGWMGGRCGPCHDRHLEGEPGREVIRVNTFLHHTAQEPPVAFSPDGGRLAAVVAPAVDVCTVRLFDVAGDSFDDLPSSWDAPRALAFSPDSLLLAAGGPGRLVIHDLESGTEALKDPGDFPADCLAFAPDGLALAVGGCRGLQLWQRQGREGAWERGRALDRPVTALAFSAGGERLALGGAGWLGVFALTGQQPVPVWVDEASPDRQPAQLAFDRHGQELVAAVVHALPAMEAWPLGYFADRAFGVEVRRYSPAGSLLQQKAAGQLRAFTLSAGGDRLLGVRPDQPVVEVIDTGTAAVLGAVGWDLEDRLVGLSVSPDGLALAAVNAGGEGKLIPWRLLLGA